MTLAKQNPGLPQPPADALAVSTRLHALIRAEIAAAGGWISFARFMELALYAPGLGYYSAGSRKLGPAGDFVTAPELSPLFGRSLARQLAELVRQGLGDILELGAGSGALAETVLAELAALDCLPRRYAILELGADLRQRQQQRLMKAAPQIAERVTWLETLPPSFSGVVLGNEVLDAIPAHRIRKINGTVYELGIRISGNDLEWATQPATGRLAATAAGLDLADDYETELNPAATALIGDLAQRLTRGVLLLIDYGFPAHEYFHPQRNRGTLMCHYRHHAHADPFLWVGLQDITAHVDFSAIARSGVDAGLELLGYSSQAQFLINCGITGLLAEVPASDAARYAPLAAQAQKLLSPAEMGELFKVIALGRGVEPPLLGFRSGDKSRTL
ncbi:MAG: class I SAM-dependent methyltransferase [Burkholderiales bacterium]